MACLGMGELKILERFNSLEFRHWSIKALLRKQKGFVSLEYTICSFQSP